MIPAVVFVAPQWRFYQFYVWHRRPVIIGGDAAAANPPQTLFRGGSGRIYWTQDVYLPWLWSLFCLDPACEAFVSVHRPCFLDVSVLYLISVCGTGLRSFSQRFTCISSPSDGNCFAVYLRQKRDYWSDPFHRFILIPISKKMRATKCVGNVCGIIMFLDSYVLHLLSYTHMFLSFQCVFPRLTQHLKHIFAFEALKCYFQFYVIMVKKTSRDRPILQMGR